jgi:hypothetical protein
VVLNLDAVLLGFLHDHLGVDSDFLSELMYPNFCHATSAGHAPLGAAASCSSTRTIRIFRLIFWLSGRLDLWDGRLIRLSHRFFPGLC